MKRIIYALALMLASGNLATTNAPLNRYELSEPESIDTTIDDAFDLLKELEGFAPVAKWDVNAWRNGHGTKAAYRGEAITKAEAGRRARQTFDKCLAELRADYPELNSRAAGALASMLYNVGSFGPELRAAIRAGHPEKIARIMARYVKVGGAVNKGVKARRAREITFLLGAGQK